MYNELLHNGTFIVLRCGTSGVKQFNRMLNVLCIPALNVNIMMRIAEKSIAAARSILSWRMDVTLTNVCHTLSHSQIYTTILLNINCVEQYTNTIVSMMRRI